MAETSGDVSRIKVEDVVSQMWQGTEEFGRKEIRSHMQNSREERQRNFYTSTDSTNEIHRTQSSPGLNEKIIMEGNGPTHADSLADHSFLSLKTKEIRDSESPNRDIQHYRITDKSRGDNQGWNIVTKHGTSEDGKRYTTSKLATTSGSEKIDGGVANYAAKCEQMASVYNDGDDKNFTKSATTSSKNVIQQEAHGGDKNKNFQTFSTSSNTSSKVVTQHRSTTEDDANFKPLPANIDNSPSTTVTRRIYTTDVPDEFKKNPNYLDGNTKVTTETRTLPDGTKVSTTRYETRGVMSSSNVEKVISEKASTKTDVRDDTNQTNNAQIIKYVEYTEPTVSKKITKIINENVAKDSFQDISKTSSTTINKQRINQDSKIVDVCVDKHPPKIIDVYVDEHPPKVPYEKQDEYRPVATTTVTRKETSSTDSSRTKKISENVKDTIHDDVRITKIITENRERQIPTNRKPIEDALVSRPSDSCASTPFGHTPGTRTPLYQPPESSAPTPQQIINHLIPHSKQPEPDFYIINTTSTVDKKIITNDFPNKTDPEPVTQYEPLERRQPIQPKEPVCEKQVTSTIKQVQTIHKTDYVTKRISVELSPTHDAFARSLRAISPDRDHKRGSTRSLKSSTSSLRSSPEKYPVDKRQPHRTTPDRKITTNDRRTPDSRESSPTKKYPGTDPRATSPTKKDAPKRTPTSPTKHTIDTNTITKRPKPKPRSRSASPTSVASDIEFVKGTPTAPKRDSSTPVRKSPTKEKPQDSTITRRDTYEERCRQILGINEKTPSKGNKHSPETSKNVPHLNQRPTPTQKSPDKYDSNVPHEIQEPHLTKKYITPLHDDEPLKIMHKTVKKDSPGEYPYIPQYDITEYTDKYRSPNQQKPTTTTKDRPITQKTPRDGKPHDKTPDRLQPHPTTGRSKEQPRTPSGHKPDRVKEVTKHTTDDTIITRTHKTTTPKDRRPDDNAPSTGRPKEPSPTRSGHKPHRESPNKVTQVTEYNQQYHKTDETTVDRTRKTTPKDRKPDETSPDKNQKRPTTDRPKESSPTPSRRQPNEESPDRTRVHYITDETINRTTIQKDHRPDDTSPSKDRKHPKEPSTTTSYRKPHGESPNKVRQEYYTVDETIDQTCKTTIPRDHRPDDKSPDYVQKYPGTDGPEEPSTTPSGRKPHGQSPDRLKKVTDYTQQYHKTDKTTVDHTQKTTTKDGRPDDRSPDEDQKYPTTDRPKELTPTLSRDKHYGESPNSVVKDYYTINETIERTRKTTTPKDRSPDDKSPDKGEKYPSTSRPKEPSTTPKRESPGRIKHTTEHTEEYYKTDKTTVDETNKSPPRDHKSVHQIPDKDQKYPITGRPEEPSATPSERKPRRESPDKITEVTECTQEHYRTDAITVDRTKKITTPGDSRPTDRYPDKVQKHPTTGHPKEPSTTPSGRKPQITSPDKVTQVIEDTENYYTTAETTVDRTRKTTTPSDRRPSDKLPDKISRYPTTGRPNEPSTIPRGRKPHGESPDKVTRVTEYTEDYYTTDKTTTDRTRKTTTPGDDKPGDRSPDKSQKYPTTGRPIEPSTLPSGRKPQSESPHRVTQVTEYTKEYHTTGEASIDLTRKTTTLGDHRPTDESPDKVLRYPTTERPNDRSLIPRGRKPHGESPDRVTHVTEYTEDYCTTDETTTNRTKKITTPGDRRPSDKSPDKVQKHPTTGLPNETSSIPSGRKPQGESPHKVMQATEYTKEYHTTDETSVEHTRKIIKPGDRRPTDESPENFLKYPTTGRPNEPSTTPRGRKPHAESPDRVTHVTEYAEDYYTTDETTTDRTQKITSGDRRPSDRSPDKSQKYPTTARPKEPSTIPSGRKPQGESPDGLTQVTEYTEEYHTTGETSVDRTQKTTTPENRRPTEESPDKVPRYPTTGRPNEPSMIPRGRKPYGESPDRVTHVTEYTEDSYTTNETTTDRTQKITPGDRRPSDRSPDKTQKYPTAGQPKDHSTIPSGHKPQGESPHRETHVTEYTQEYTTSGETSVDRTRKITTPGDRRPTDESPDKILRHPTTERPNQPSTIPRGRKPHGDSPNRVTHVTEHTEDYCTTNKTTTDRTQKLTPVDRRPTDRSPDKTQKYPTTGRPKEPSTVLSQRKPQGESPDRVTQVTEYTEEYHTTDETSVDRTRKITTPGDRRPTDESPDKVLRYPTTGPPNEPQTIFRESKPRGESPNRVTHVTEYTQDYYTTDETTTDRTQKLTPGDRRPSDRSPDKAQKYPITGRPKEPSTTPSGRKPQGESPDRVTQVTEYTEEYHATGETSVDHTRKTTSGDRRPSDRSPNEAHKYPTVSRPKQPSTTHSEHKPHGESPDTVTQVSEYTGEYHTTKETTVDRTRKTTTSGDRRPIDRSPDKPQKYPITGRPKEPSTIPSRHKPHGESPDRATRITEYTEERHKTDKTAVDRTQKTITPVSHKPSDRFPDKVQTSPSTGRPKQHSTTPSKLKPHDDSPNSLPQVSGYTEEYYTTDKTTIDRTRKTTTPGNRKPSNRSPEKDQKYPTTGRPKEPSIFPSGRKPHGESPDRITQVTEYTEEYRRTDDRAVDHTQITTTPGNRRPGDKSPDKVLRYPSTGRPKESLTPSGRDESPDKVTQVTQYSEEYYTTDETTIDRTRKTKTPGDRRPRDRSPDKVTGRPKEASTPSGRIPRDDSPDRTTQDSEYTEEYHTTDETTIDRTRKTTTPGDRRPSDRSPDKIQKYPTTRQSNEPSTIPGGRKPHGESPDRVRQIEEYTRQYHTTDEKTVDRTRKTTTPGDRRPSDRYPDKGQKCPTTGRPKESSITPSDRKPRGESPGRVRQVTEYTEEYSTVDETTVNRNRKTTTPGNRRPSDRSPDKVLKYPTTERPREPTTSIGRKPRDESPDTVTQVTKYTDDYYMTDETTVNHFRKTTPGNRKPSDRSPDNVQRYPTTGRPKESSTSPSRRKPQGQSTDMVQQVTEYTEEYRTIDETTKGRTQKETTPGDRTPTNRSPDRVQRHPTAGRPKETIPSGRKVLGESPDRVKQVIGYTEQYHMVDEKTIDRTRKTIVPGGRKPSTKSPDRVERYPKTGHPEEPRGLKHDNKVIDKTQRRPKESYIKPSNDMKHGVSRPNQISSSHVPNQKVRKPSFGSRSPDRISQETVHKNDRIVGITVNREKSTTIRKVPEYPQKVHGKTVVQKSTTVQPSKSTKVPFGHSDRLTPIKQSKVHNKVVQQPRKQPNRGRHSVTTTIQVIPKTKPGKAPKVKPSEPSQHFFQNGRPQNYSDAEDEEVHEVIYTTEDTFKGTRKTDAKLIRTTSDQVIKTPHRMPVRGQSKPDVFDDHDKPSKIVTTKSFTINNDFDSEKEIIVNLHRSTSSREPTPDTIYPRPVSEDDDEIPRYPDNIYEPDEFRQRKKPTKLSDISIIETEVTENFSSKPYLIGERGPEVNKVDETDECLLSVSQKVNKFADNVPGRSPKPDIVVDKTYTTDRIRDTTTKLKKTSYDIPDRPKSPIFRDYPEDNSKTDDCLLSVSDKVTKFTTVAKQTTSPDYKRPVSLAKMDVTDRRKSPHKELPKPHTPSTVITECVQIESEKDTYERLSPKRQIPTKTKTNEITQTSTKPNQPVKNLKKDSYIDELVTTPKSSRKDAEPKTVLSPTGRLRSTESVRRAKELFENIAKDTNKDILSRPSVFEGRKFKPTPRNTYITDKADTLRSVHLVKHRSSRTDSPENDGDEPGYMRPLNRSPRPHSPYYGRAQSPRDHSESPSRGRSPRPHDPSLDKIPHYMWPLDRSSHEHEHSPLRSRESTPDLHRKIRSRGSSPDGSIPGYMRPLERHDHHHSHEKIVTTHNKRRSRDSSPDGDTPGYMKHLERREHYHGSVKTAALHSKPRSRECSPGYMKPLERHEHHHGSEKIVTAHSKRRSRDSSPDGGTPGYMKPLERHEHHHDSIKTTILHSKIRSRESSPDGDIPGYMKPLEKHGRHHDKSRSRDSSPDGYMKPLEKHEHHHDSTKTTTHKHKYTVSEIQKILTTQNIEEIYEIELLETLLERAVNYDQRRKIRSQIRTVKQLITDNKLSTVLSKKQPPKPRGKTPDKTIRNVDEHVDKKSLTVSKKYESHASKPKGQKPIDLITSSYGVGPTDENGSPLFGLKALRAQNRTDTTKVQGTVIRSHYYSENGQEPTGEVCITKYSNDPNDFDDPSEETDGIVSVTTTQKFGTKGSPSYKKVISDDFEGEKHESVVRKSTATNITRHGSVKEMSKKFIDNAVETSKNEKSSSYPKAGLIFRSSSFKDTPSRSSDSDVSPENRESTVTTVRRTTTSRSSTGEHADTFLTNKTRVRGVQDVITRMKNSDDDVRAGDSTEDVEARSMLNKFIGSQVILSGMETRSSSSPSSTVMRTTTTTTTTIKEDGKPTVISRTFTHPVTKEDLDTVWDNKTLKLLLERSTEYEERCLIRGRLQDVMAEQDVCADDVVKTKGKPKEGVEETVDTTERTFVEGPVTTTQVTTKVTSQQVSKKPMSPFAKFRQLDKQNSLNTPPGTPRTPTGSRPLFKFTDPELNRQASTVKERLLQWCQMKTKEYENVQLDNFSSSWADGLAFCALIHHFMPDAFDYHALTPKERRHNFTLAFRIADEKADIFPLLDVDDMVATRKPDWKCVFTYVQAIYTRFKNED